MPDGLAGPNIPIEARITAVADSYDAMTSGRPYRVAQLTASEALEEVRANSGTQFDPDVVRAFLQAVESGGIPAPGAD
jgi:HD-GYP domain-containing protein (c-di-GMP phosphodiesterase class II)